MVSQWDNSPVYSPDYDYLPQGTELLSVFCTLTSVESISLSGPHPNSPLQPTCHSGKNFHGLATHHVKDQFVPHFQPVTG